jgi:hypothetical protein
MNYIFRILTDLKQQETAMQEPTALEGNTVFSKTEKGREEIGRRCHGLNPHQRRLLIVFDGRKDLQVIASIMHSPDFADNVSFLAREGLITTVEVPAIKPQPVGSENSESAPSELDETEVHEVTPPYPAPAHVLATPGNEVVLPVASATLVALKEPPRPTDELALTDDPAKIRQVKDFMTTTTQTYLGLLGANVIQRIERAKDATQLMSVLGHWHMALRDSKQGGRFAGPYLDQVRKSLKG